MPGLPALPRSELEVARVVWALQMATVRQVLDALPADRGLDFWTVQTYLRRLHDKGYLKVRKEGRNNVYSPAVNPDRVVRNLVGDLVNRLFDGETFTAVQHLIEDRGLSDAEIGQLESLLASLKAKRNQGGGG